MFWINNHLNACSLLSWCSAEIPPYGVSAGALSPHCQLVLFLLQRNNVLVSSGCFLLVFIISFWTGSWTSIATNGLLVLQSCTQKRFVPGKQDGGVNMTLSPANLELWKASLGCGTVLHKSWEQKIPFLPRCFTAACLGYQFFVSLGLRYVAVSAVPWQR